MRIKMPETQSDIHLDFVPMVDVLFNLLIFFLLATTIKQAEREMQIALPYAAAATPISVSMREFIINVDAQGGIVVVGQKVTPEELTTMVAEAIAANPEQKSPSAATATPRTPTSLSCSTSARTPAFRNRISTPCSIASASNRL